MKGKASTFVVLIVAIIAAVILGSKVAQESYGELTIYILIACPLLFIAKGHRYSWQIMMLLSLSGVTFYHGFIYMALHVGAVVLFSMFIIHFIARYDRGMPQAFRRSGGKLVVGVGIVWLVYGAIHFAANFGFPHIPGEFQVKNSLKAYFRAFIPIFILLWLIQGPTRFRLGKRWDIQLVYIIFGTLIVNVVYMVILYRSGYTAEGVSGTDTELMEARGLHIPIVNMGFNLFALRSLGPLAAAIGLGLFIVPGWFRSQSRLTKLIILAIFPLSICGCVLSGGRAAVVLSGLYCFVLLVAARKIGLLMFFSFSGLIFVILVNLFSGFINNKLPSQIGRPLQYVMIDKGRANESIEGSSDFRKSLYDASIDHWLSDARVLLTGRSVYRYLDNEMDQRMRFGDKENFVITNLRAGTCHALLPTSLVQYGAIGTLIYYCLYVSIILFCWRFSRYCRKHYADQPDLLLFPYVLAVITAVSLIVVTIGGGWFELTTILFIGIFRSRMHVLEDEEARELEEGKKTESVSGYT